MASSSHNARVLLSAYSWSPLIHSASVSNDTEILDVTTLADTAKRSAAGLSGATFTMEGFMDTTVATQSAVVVVVESVGTSTPVTYGPAGFALGRPTFLISGWRSTFEEGSEVNGVNNFTWQVQGDGTVGYAGVSLHDLTAETADTNHSSYDRGITSSANGAVAHLHTTAFSGLTNNIVTIEDSANDSTWATIGTFTTVTGVSSERIFISGTVRRYLRCVTNVTGTGSVTYSCSIAPL